MPADFSNDNPGPRLPADPDPHGQAALLLVESLIHGLIARGVIGVVDAVDIVDIASEVRVEIAADGGETKASLGRSMGLIQAISASLSRDIPRA